MQFLLLTGFKTYIAAAALAIIVVLEKIIGIDVPGVTVQGDWLFVLINAFGLGGLRAAIGR